jgi:ArsR family transcriptional regulator, arsenate/arsenite/antimonite-responsive transcriptional repressor
MTKFPLDRLIFAIILYLANLLIMNVGCFVENILNIVKAVSDGNRLRVVMILTQHQELCVCEITEMLTLATPTVSRHISVLQKAGLVKSRKDSRWIHYRLSDSFPPALLEWFKDMLNEAEEIKRDNEKVKSILCRETKTMCSSIKEDL